MRRSLLIAGLIITAGLWLGVRTARVDSFQAHVPVGNAPVAVAVNPSTNKTYVANYDSNNVTIINGVDNSTQTVLTGLTPNCLAVNSATNKVYVSNYNSGSVTVIDGVSNSTATVPAGTRPFAIGIDSTTNRIYVANFDSGNVTVINGVDNSTATVAVGTNPKAVAVNSQTHRIYVANYGSNTVTVIKEDNSTLTLPVGTAPYDISVNPATNKIYVANYGSGDTNSTVTVINGADNSTAPITVGKAPTAVAVNKSTNKIYVANMFSNNVTVIDGVTNSTETVEAGTQPFTLVINSSVNQIYAANYGSGNVTVIDGTNLSPSTISVGTNPYAVAVNLQTNKVYVANNGSQNVTVINGPTPQMVTISGTVRNVNNRALNDIIVKMTGDVTSSMSTNNAGVYSFTVNAIGSYDVKPFHPSVTDWAPGNSQHYANLTQDVLNANFLAQFPTFTVSGTVKTEEGVPLPGVVIMESGRKFTTNSNGDYTAGPFTVLGDYSLSFDRPFLHLTLPYPTTYDLNPGGANFFSMTGDVLGLNSTGIPVIRLETSPATTISSTRATLNAGVNPKGITASAFFLWGTFPHTPSQATPPQTINAATSTQPLTTDLTGLEPGTTYYFRAVGSSSAGSGQGSQLSFTTAAPAWEAVVLTADHAEIKTWTVGGKTYGYVKPLFPNAGYRVVDWGQAVRNLNDFTADAGVEKFTGPSIQALTTTAQIYYLGPLANGTYNFNFKTSGTTAKSLQFTLTSTVPPPNPIDDARQFVKQQYRDFLNREADQAGEDFWTDNITQCNDAVRRPAGQTVEQCTLRQRETTSGAFFRSPEFQYTGYYVYRMYQGALGRQPKLSEFTPDALFVGNGIIVNGQLSAAKINQNKIDLATQFVNCTDATKYRCAEFKAIYDGLSNPQYVDKLFQTTGVNASASERAALVAGLNANPPTETRASVVQKIVDGINVIAEDNQQFTTTYGQAFYTAEFNRAFVQLEYFGYMKRDPDEAGYTFWLDKLNLFGGDFVKAEMVLAFISSPEYRARFGQP